jgi:hypothetical protein
VLNYVREISVFSSMLSEIHVYAVPSVFLNPSSPAPLAYVMPVIKKFYTSKKQEVK